MKATVKIGAIKLEVEVEDSDRELALAAQRIIDNNQESIEAAIAEGVVHHIERLLPGIKATCTGAWNEGEESENA